MGVPPPPDAPDLPTQDAAQLGASFQATPPAATLCGFGIPGFSISISIPGIPFPPPFWPINLNLSLALNCDLNNPLDANVSFGGGRVAQPPTDPDDVDK